MFKFSIRIKLIIYIIIAILLIFAPTILYIGVKNKSEFYKMGVKDVNATSQKYSKEVHQQIDNYFHLIRILASVNISYINLSPEERQQYVLKNYSDILKNYKNLDAIWDSWEFDSIDINGNTERKRHSYFAERVNDKIVTKKELKEISSGYTEITDGGNEMTLEPYLYSVTGETKDEDLVTTLSVKMFNDGEFIGIVGVDIKLSNIQNLIKNSNNNKTEINLISEKGSFLSNKNKELIGKSSKLNDSIISVINEKEIISKIVNINNIEYYTSYTKIRMGNSNNFWILSYKTPKAELDRKATENVNLTFTIGLIGILLLTIFIAIITIPIIGPIKSITNNLSKMAKGEFNNTTQKKNKRKDEIGKMINAMNNVNDSLIEKTTFAKQIGEGKLDTDINLLSNNDTLGLALVNMRNNLKNAKEQEYIYKIDDNKRQWANKGYAYFAELLRKNNNDLNILSNEIVKHIVKYVELNQAAIFLQDDSNKDKLKSTATYAYERKKHIDLSIQKGEGLVGTCFIEGESTYITDIPQNYIQITSGLGESNPTALLLVPLKNENEIIGVLEMASFKKIEKHEIVFIEKIASTIASTILTTKNNEKTLLLLEQNSQQTEEMRAQEEEMRQNMEELIATQEESERKTFEANALFSTLNKANYVINCNKEGIINYISEGYLTFLSMPSKSLLSKKYKNLLDLDDKANINFDIIWKNVLAGKIEKVIVKIKIDNNEFSLHQIFMPIKDEDENITKVIITANNINTFKKL